MDTPRLQIKFKKTKKNMKTRSKIEILEILIDKNNLNLYFETGLCNYIADLYLFNIITVQEYICIKDLLSNEFNNLKNLNEKYCPYVWKKHYVVPRYRFLKELIIKLNELENKNK